MIALADVIAAWASTSYAWVADDLTRYAARHLGADDFLRGVVLGHLPTAEACPDAAFVIELAPVVALSQRYLDAKLPAAPVPAGLVAIRREIAETAHDACVAHCVRTAVAADDWYRVADSLLRASTPAERRCAVAAQTIGHSLRLSWRVTDEALAAAAKVLS